MLDSWVVSQIWLDSDSNELSQSRVGRENPGYESSQSRITLIVIWVRVESTGYCLSQSWVTDFSKRKRQDLAIICNFTEKEPTYSYIRPHPPPPGQQLFPKLRNMWWVVSQIWLNSDSNELSQSWVRLVNLGFELSRSWIRLANLGFELSRSWVTWIFIWVRVESVRKNESSTTLIQVKSDTLLSFRHAAPAPLSRPRYPMPSGHRPPGMWRPPSRRSAVVVATWLEGHNRGRRRDLFLLQPGSANRST